MLDAPRRVIVLDEDAFVGRPDDDEDSDWEDINSFADVNSDAGASTLDYESEDSDYLLARRLQDEEYARVGRRPVSERRVSGTGRRAYADVLAEPTGSFSSKFS
jgi:hypothetical protein